MTTGGGTDRPDVVLSPGAHVEPEVEVLGRVRVGPGAVVLGRLGADGPYTILHDDVEVGANATVLAGVVVAMGARISPGSVVTRSVPPLAIVEGNPARIVGYVDAVGTPALDTIDTPSTTPVIGSPRPSKVRGVSLHRFRLVRDLRGSLTVGEFGRDIPFQPARYFIVFDVPSAETRGEHAHLRCAQFLSAIRGSVSVVADDGLSREEFLLDSPDLGLFVPPMVWAIQYRYSSDAALLVLASHHYDSADYIRDYRQFVELARDGNDREHR